MTLSSSESRRSALGSRISWVALALISVHVLTVTVLRPFRLEPLSSGVMLLAAALLLSCCSFRASARSAGFSRRFWFLCGATFALWSAADLLDMVNEFYWTSMDLNPSSLLVLFFLATVPMSFALTRTSRDPETDSRWLLLVDAMQLLALAATAVLVYLHVSDWATGAELTATRLEILHWRNVWLTMTLVLRACVTQEPAQRRLFATMAAGFSLYTLTTMFGNWGLEIWRIGSGNWCDLAWSVPFGLMAVFAEEWKDPAHDEPGRPSAATTHRFRSVLERGTPVVLASASLVSGLIEFRRHPALGSALLGLAFLLFALRASLVQSHREREISELRAEAEPAPAAASMVPICASCKMVRQGGGEWQPIERYFAEQTGMKFTHGICPPCAEDFYAEAVRRPT